MTRRRSGTTDETPSAGLKSVRLPKHLEDFLDGQVRAGKHPDRATAIVAALREEKRRFDRSSRLETQRQRPRT
jgi:Arc/MetJ-type ribon-helix-helix transcriptional regulator